MYTIKLVFSQLKVQDDLKWNVDPPYQTGFEEFNQY